MSCSDVQVNRLRRFSGCWPRKNPAQGRESPTSTQQQNNTVQRLTKHKVSENYQYRETDCKQFACTTWFSQIKSRRSLSSQSKEEPQVNARLRKKTFKKNNRSANSLSVFGKSIFMKPGQVNVDHHVLHIVCQPVIAHMTEDSARSRVTRSGTHPNSLDDACLSSKILVPKACPRRGSPPEALDVLKFTTVAIRTNWRHPKIIR